MKFLNKYRTAKEMMANESPEKLNKMFQHGKPLSRRDFLAAGAIQFAATMTLPPILNVLSNAGIAQAQDACAENTMSALVTLNLSGGAAMGGNFVPHDEGRQLLQSYTRLGLGSRGNIATRIAYEFGNAPFFDQSQMLAGIRTTATADTLANTAFIAIPCQSQDDSATNKFDISGLATKAGLAGAILPNMGTTQTNTGIRQMPSFVAPPSPLVVGNVGDINNALGVAGSLNALNDSQKGRLFSLINNLSSTQARSIASNSGGETLGQLVTAATGDNVPLVSSADNGTDPLNDAAVSANFNTIWANNNNQNLQNQNAGSRERVFSSMVYNALKKNAGTVNLQMGGYDYHGQGRATQDTRDLNAGRVMGQVLESAAAMQQPLFLVIASDGAVGSVESAQPGADFTSDRGQGGVMYCMAYHPVARPQASDFQVGQFKPGANEQAADDRYLTGGEPELAALAAFANFLSFNGRLNSFESVIPRVWNSTQLDQVTKINKG